MVAGFYEGFWRGLFEWHLGLLLTLPYGFLFYRTVDRFLQVQEKWWARTAIFLAGLVGGSMVIFIADAFNILAFLPFFVAALWFCTKGSRIARFTMILILYPMMMSFNAIMDNGILSFPGTQIHYSVFQIVCRVLFWLLLARTARAFVPDTDEGRPLLSARLWALLDLLALTPAAALFVLVIYPSHGYASDQEIFIFRGAAMCILPVVIMSLFGLLYTVVVLSQHEALRRKENMWELQNLYYQNLEQEQTQVRRLRHDMANHLQALSGLLDSPEKARGYLESLMSRPGLTVGKRYCGNTVVNTVLAGKSVLMEEKGIRGDITVVLPEELPLSATDLCALFANALDNAIEACEKLRDPEERAVWVRARADKGLLMVQITNRTNREIPATLETTKEDKARHGYGLSILREIAERANGTCSIEQRPGVFELVITIPMERKVEGPPFRR